MKSMRSSEKMFASVMGGIFALIILYWVGGGLLSMFTSRYASIANLNKMIAERKDKVAKGQIAQRKLIDWERRSLPTDPNVARSLYRNWLYQTVEKIGLTSPNVTPQLAAGTRGVYDRLRLNVDASGSLEQLTRFLYEFYQADFLHQVTQITVKPNADNKALDLSITVEALSLPGADHKDKLNEGASKRLAFADVGKYIDLIAKRNVFSPYVPEKPKVVKSAPPAPPAFDAAKFTYVTAIMEANETLEVWLDDRTQGKLLKLHEGDTFELGGIKGSVTHIGLRRVELLIGEQPTSVLLGESLFDAMHRTAPLPTQAASDL